MLEIIYRNDFLWEHKLSKTMIDLWLENFCGDCYQKDLEKELALDILNKFIFYTEKELRYLCKVAFSTLIREEIVNNPASYSGKNSIPAINRFITKCRFSYIGRAGESGALISYYFRQENGPLPIEQFKDLRYFQKGNDAPEDLSQLHFVFIDDFLGTGRTAIDFWGSEIEPYTCRYPRANWYYVALVATNRGYDNVQLNTGFKLICPQVFDDSYRAFNDNSSLFPDDEKREVVKKICEHYGGQLVPTSHILGYRNSQALLGFNHNIPDNTLPIIWKEKNIKPGRNWYPIFKREEKI